MSSVQRRSRTLSGLANPAQGGGRVRRASRRNEQPEVKHTAPVVSREAWQRALDEVRTAEVRDDYPDAVTANEFATMVGLGRLQAYRRLLQLIEAGKAERVMKRRRMSDGGVRPVAAYRLLAGGTDGQARRP